MKINFKNSLVRRGLMIIIILAVIATIAWLIYSVKVNTNYIKLPSSDWKTYNNTKLGISLDYPSTWGLEEYEDEFSWHVKFSDTDENTNLKSDLSKDSFEIKSGCILDYYNGKWKKSDNYNYSWWIKEDCISNYSIVAIATNNSAKIVIDKIISTLRFSSAAWKYSKANSIPYESRVRIISPKIDEKYTIGDKKIIEWNIDRDASNFSIELFDSETRDSVMIIASNEFIRSSGIDGIFRYEWIIPNIDINKKYFIKIAPIESRELLGMSSEFNIIESPIKPIIKLPSVNPDINNSTIISNYGVQGKCGLNLNYPIANTSVKFPLVISGTIDNSNYRELGCAWNVFEGVIGTAQLYYYSNTLGWKAIGESVIVNSSGYNNGTFALTSTINFKNNGIGLPNTTLMKIVFTEENPSGIANTTDTFELPVILQSDIIR